MGLARIFHYLTRNTEDGGWFFWKGDVFGVGERREFIMLSRRKTASSLQGGSYFMLMTNEALWIGMSSHLLVYGEVFIW